MAGVASVGAICIWGQISLLRGEAVHRRAFGGIPSSYPLRCQQDAAHSCDNPKWSQTSPNIPRRKGDLVKNQRVMGKSTGLSIRALVQATCYSVILNTFLNISKSWVPYP